MRALVPIGRALFASLFVMTLFGHLSKEALVQATTHGVPFATVLVPLTGIIATAGGVLVLIGYRARFGAFLLLLFLVPVTLIMHRFWSAPDAGTAALQQVMFMKNTSLIGATLMIMYWGSGPYSLDG